MLTFHSSSCLYSRELPFQQEAGASQHDGRKRSTSRPHYQYRQFSDLLPAGYLNDMHVYDPGDRSWTALSAAVSGTPPSPRSNLCFTSLGGLLYVQGGQNTSGMKGVYVCEGQGKGGEGGIGEVREEPSGDF